MMSSIELHVYSNPISSGFLFVYPAYPNVKNHQKCRHQLIPICDWRRKFPLVFLFFPRRNQDCSFSIRSYELRYLPLLLEFVIDMVGLVYLQDDLTAGTETVRLILGPSPNEDPTYPVYLWYLV